MLVSLRMDAFTSSAAERPMMERHMTAATTATRIAAPPARKSSAGPSAKERFRKANGYGCAELTSLAADANRILGLGDLDPRLLPQEADKRGGIGGRINSTHVEINEL